jgi:hypothetical protein
VHHHNRIERNPIEINSRTTQATTTTKMENDFLGLINSQETKKTQMRKLTNLQVQALFPAIRDL